MVTPQGSKLWRLAYRFSGKQKLLASGAYPAISLAEARSSRDGAKRLLASGASRDERSAARPSALWCSTHCFTTFAVTVATPPLQTGRRPGQRDHPARTRPFAQNGLIRFFDLGYRRPHSPSATSSSQSATEYVNAWPKCPLAYSQIRYPGSRHPDWTFPSILSIEPYRSCRLDVGSDNSANSVVSMQCPLPHREELQRRRRSRCFACRGQLPARPTPRRRLRSRLPFLPAVPVR